MKIDTTLFKSLYKKLAEYVSKSNKYIPEDICLFFPQVGENYDDAKNEDKILFVGRCANGWITRGLDIEKLFNEEDPNTIVNRKDQMIWVEESWQKKDKEWADYKNSPEEWQKKNPTRKKPYSTTMSAFWRVIKNITKNLFDLSDDNWYKNIAYTNLYKASPYKNMNSSKAANPEGNLPRLQKDICIEILNHEIEYFNPKFIIFLTSPWEKFYWEHLKQIGYNEHKSDIIQWGKNYNVYYQKFNDKIFILSHHPAGKNECLHIKTIIDVIKKYQ
jgi:hypothetical protein